MTQENASWVDFKEVKSRVSIVQILERYGALDSLQKSENGDRMSGVCPIHGGTNKTHFRVSVSKNCWNCFGKCQCGGNVIDFVSRKEGIPFREAAMLIKEWFSDDPSEKPKDVPEPRFDPSKLGDKRPFPVDAPSSDESSEEPAAEPEGITENKRLSFELSNLDPAHPYLRERGLTEETIAAFGLGYCGKGLLRGHIAIPIHNAAGDLVAYAGRLVKEGKQAKYKLPKDFRKSLEVFNLHRATRSEQQAPLVVVEGFFDCFKLQQAGYEKVAAVMGSSLSEAQEAAILQNVDAGKGIILFFDNDDAGRKGQSDALYRLARHMSVRTIVPGEEGGQPEHFSEGDLRVLLPFPKRRVGE